MTLPVQLRLAALRASSAAAPGRWGRFTCALRAVALAVGVLTFALVVFGRYDRAVSVAGRSEVISIRSDGTDFAAWSFPSADLWPDLDAAAESGTVLLQVAAGAEARFVRSGRGPLTLVFSAPDGRRGSDAHGSGEACPAGAARVGLLRRASGEEAPLCDSARLTVAVRPGDPPLVVSLRGAATIGEEVRAGAGAQPMLLGAAALLFARHGGWFGSVCAAPGLNSLCERFVASRLDLAAGDSIRFSAGGDANSEATGFLRLDADDINSGLLFDLAAPQTGVEVRRLKGEAFEISESLFDRVTKSPVIQTLNATLVALSLIWWFARAPGAARGDHAGVAGPGPASVVLMLTLAAPAHADQAMLRAGEVGQAILRSRADRCYAISPRHVLGTETAANLTAPGRRLGDADLLRQVPAAPEDLALMSVRAIPNELCPAFEGVQSLDSLLRTRAAAVLRLVRPDGSLERFPLSVQAVDVETFEVRPEDGTTLAQGMSGGTILVGDQPAGMLVDVTDGGKLGRVARLDRVFERLAPYLGTDLARASPPAAVSAGTVAPRPAGYLEAAVVRWSVEPVALANRADALLDAGGEPWRVRGGGPAEIVLKLQAGAVFNAIVVDAGGLDDPPRSVEVLIGRGERGPWQSIALFAIEPQDRERRRATAPMRAGYALVRTTGLQPGAETMALSGVRFSAP